MLELVVALACYMFVIVVSMALFNQSIWVYRRVTSSDRATRSLRLARTYLERDLALANPDQLRRSLVPDLLGGGGSTGEAVWFLSPVDPVSGRMMRKEDGMPFWQRNVLYYVTIPTNHNELFGQSCAGGAGPGNLDDRCPHKLLVRKVIDSGAPTVPSDESSEETLIAEADIAPFLSQPTGHQLPAQAGVSEAKVATGGLLYFRTVSAPAPRNIPVELFVDLRALALEEAQRNVRVGSDSLFNSKYTRQGPFSIYLRN